MGYNLERGIRLVTKPEHETLYNWAILETDAQGRRKGGDQIPWVWTLRFVATSCVLSDSLSLDPGSSIEWHLQHYISPEQDTPGGPPPLALTRPAASSASARIRKDSSAAWVTVASPLIKPPSLPVCSIAARRG
jgi:hypothetical protein